MCITTKPYRAEKKDRQTSKTQKELDEKARGDYYCSRPGNLSYGHFDDRNSL